MFVCLKSTARCSDLNLFLDLTAQLLEKVIYYLTFRYNTQEPSEIQFSF